MARYKVAHDLDRTWVGRGPNGEWAWVPYERAFKFSNYFKAREAVDSMPDEKRVYGFSYKQRINFMKVEYTDEEKSRPGNSWMND